MDAFWNEIVWNNTVKDWAIALSIILVAVVLLRVLQSVVIKRLKALTRRTKSTLDDFLISIVSSLVMPLLYILAIYSGLQYLQATERMKTIGRIALMVVVAFFLLRIASAFVAYIFHQTFSKKDQSDERIKQSKGILLLINFFIWVIGLLFLIDNLGYNITTLITGLGIGGIAIALAAQAVLGDFFGYFVIFFDKPFQIGDFVIMDDKMGHIEHIGLKTTRIKTLNGEQLIVANTDITKARVHNYKRMEERRILFSFGVVYNTPASKLKQIPTMVKQIIESVGDLRFDRAHFKSFGDFSLDFEVVYYVLSPDFSFYMDRQQEINFRIFELFEKEGIEFAFPTRTLHVQNAVNVSADERTQPPSGSPVAP